jgi:hypothetical protein
MIEGKPYSIDYYCIPTLLGFSHDLMKDIIHNEQVTPLENI